MTLVELWLLIALTMQNVYTYPQRINILEKSKITMDTDRSFLQTSNSFKKSFEDDEPLASEEWFGNNDEPNRRIQRDSSGISSKTQKRSAIAYPSLQDMQSDGKIVFPGEISQVPVCKESTYCEKLDSYPEELVTNAIRQNETLKYLAGVDVVSNIAQRIDVMDDMPLCVSTEQVIFPQSAENKDNQWKYIANQENFKQGIRIEKCSKENASCKVISSPAEGYKTSCKQKYVYRQLAAVLSDGSIVPDTFKFPSSCCCHVSFVPNPYTRMGVIGDQQKSETVSTKTRRRK